MFSVLITIITFFRWQKFLRTWKIKAVLKKSTQFSRRRRGVPIARAGGWWAKKNHWVNSWFSGEGVVLLWYCCSVVWWCSDVVVFWLGGWWCGWGYNVWLELHHLLIEHLIDVGQQGDEWHNLNEAKHTDYFLDVTIPARIGWDDG